MGANPGNRFFAVYPIVIPRPQGGTIKHRTMEINGKIHLLFEQSGTFKEEFRKLGYVAQDYDIRNDYGKTDHIIDLFREIGKAYNKKKSVFDNIGQEDLIMAFFPCTYFTGAQNMFYQLDSFNTKNLNNREKINLAIERVNQRTKYHTTLYKLLEVVTRKKLRLIIENPYGAGGYITHCQNFIKPTLIDYNRQLRGDYYKKPTAYWYINCRPTTGQSFENPGKTRKINNLKRSAGNEERTRLRSEIAPSYARNFICDFIIGYTQKHSQLLIF